MAAPENPGSAQTQFDDSLVPSDARVHLHRAIRRRLRWETEDEVEDLVSEGLVRFFRAIRREKPREPAALLYTIGNRVALDWISRRVRWRHIMTDEAPENWDPADPREMPAEQMEDPVALATNLIRLFFHQHGECASLFEDYRKELDWKTVADRCGETPVAIRKRWSRCVAKLREAALDSVGFAPLREWFGADA